MAFPEIYNGAESVPTPSCLANEPVYPPLHEQWASELYQYAKTPLERLEALAEMSLPLAWQTVVQNHPGITQQELAMEHKDAVEPDSARLWQTILHIEYSSSPQAVIQETLQHVAQEYPEMSPYFPYAPDASRTKQPLVDVYGGPVARAIPEEYYAMQAAYHAGYKRVAANKNTQVTIEGIVQEAVSLLCEATRWKPKHGEYLDALAWAQLGSQVGNMLLDVREQHPVARINLNYFKDVSSDLESYHPYMATLRRKNLPHEERLAQTRADLNCALEATLQEIENKPNPDAISRKSKMQDILASDQKVEEFFDHSYTKFKQEFFDDAKHSHKAALLAIWLRPLFEEQGELTLQPTRVPWASGNISEHLIDETFDRYRHEVIDDTEAGDIEYDALIRYIFGNEAPIDRSLRYTVGFFPPHLVGNLVKIKEVIDGQSEQLTAKDQLLLATIVDGDHQRLQSLFGMGYKASDIVRQPALGMILPYGTLKEICPEGRVSKNRWLADHAFEYMRGGWNRSAIGKILGARMTNKKYENTAFTCAVFEYFQVPAEYGGKVLHDTKTECRYLAGLLQLDATTGQRLRLGGKQAHIEKLFWNSEHQFIYKSLLALSTEQGQLSPSALRSFIRTNQVVFFDQLTDTNNPLTTDRVVRSVFCTRLHAATEAVIEQMTAQENPRLSDIHDLLRELKTYGSDRQAYIQNTTNWLLRHAATPDVKLVLAWQARSHALEAGIEDGADAILRWYQPRQMKLVFNDEIMPGTNMTNAEIGQKYSHWVNELSRHYAAPDILDIIKTCAMTDKKPPVLPAFRAELYDQNTTFVGSILDRDDPRGATIGHDTRCCMGWKRQAKECITTGYNVPEAGFFLLESDDRPVAQSFFFVSQRQPDTLVLDSVEALPGRNPVQALRAYRTFWESYLAKRYAEDPKWPIRKVQIGVRYDLSHFHHLPEADKAPVDHYISYSDARKQRVLLDLTLGDLAAAKSLHILDAARPRQQAIHLNTIKDKESLVVQLEEAAFPPDFQTLTSIDKVTEKMNKPSAEDFSFLAFSDPHNLGSPLGACLAYIAEQQNTKDTPTLLIDSFATLPGASTGVAICMLKELLERAKDAGITDVVFDGRENTSYRLATSESLQRRLRSWGFAVLKGDSAPQSSENGEKTFDVTLQSITSGPSA